MKRLQRRLTQLDSIRIASPCHVRWDSMSGDERSRFCSSCQLRVYNLAAMTAEEAADLISKSDGNLCVRLYRRRDGTILTRDCPTGQKARGLRKRWAAALSALTALTVFIGMPRRTMGVMTRRIDPHLQAARELSIAILDKNTVDVRRLLREGVDPNVRVGDEKTALMIAAENGATEAARILIQRGADVNAKDETGRTALQIARENHQKTIIALLEKRTKAK